MSGRGGSDGLCVLVFDWGALRGCGRPPRDCTRGDSHLTEDGLGDSDPGLKGQP